MSNTQAAFAHATLGYENAHERALLEAFANTIFETSGLSDWNAVVVRTTDALLAVLTAKRVPGGAK